MTNHLSEFVMRTNFLALKFKKYFWPEKFKIGGKRQNTIKPNATFLVFSNTVAIIIINFSNSKKKLHFLFFV